MLHLLPIRLLLWAVFALAATAVLAAAYSGSFGAGDPVHDVGRIIRWSSIFAVAMVVVVHAAWRWLPAVQLLVFPYLGGHWSGVVQFQGRDSEEQRAVSLEIRHTLFGLKLLLESSESVSWTLLVHADRNPDFQHFRVYYVYLNERKEGVVGGGERYRGLAVLRVIRNSGLELQGDYFTDSHRRGTLHLKLDNATQRWKLWC